MFRVSGLDQCKPAGLGSGGAGNLEASRVAIGGFTIPPETVTPTLNTIYGQILGCPGDSHTAVRNGSCGVRPEGAHHPKGFSHRDPDN
ncbi:hypothetical protein PROH_14345 [Prochlorothrix hollandica PCC 9006 = CALU 1027]|uniref:Uncharacterized protein n=1 Tax=Prochlorothrix hollandica PCC 9006 = CALU 1027 TaxID=317619 RepID=A0A0M2PV66_PROHO|nr:hypothetical protein PROH_14345 [Prochlorothrix hollandica PCC 9006 = CALU 1027]